MSFNPNSIATRFDRLSRLGIGFIVFGLAAAYLLANYIILNDLLSLALAGMACIALAIIAATAVNWRNGVYLLLAWLLVEDLVRKYLGNNMAVYFAKDVLLAAVYFSFFARRRKDHDVQTFRPPFLKVLLLVVWFACMQVFNPASPSMFFGIMGLKIDFYYIPLMLIGYALADSEEALRHFFYFNLGLIAIVISLGIVQSIAGPGFLNPAVMGKDIENMSSLFRKAPISGVLVYRPTSVFVSAGRFADLLIISWLMVFGFSGYLLLRHRKGRIFALVVLALIAAGCLMCGSRGVFMWTSISAVVGGLAFLWGAPWSQGQRLRVIRAIQRAALGVALSVVVLLAIYPKEFLGRIAVYSETLDPRSPASELVHRTRDYPMAEFLKAFDNSRWPYGYGLGTASLGVQYVARFFTVQPLGGVVESGYGDIVFEQGIVGLMLWLIMSVVVVLSAWKITRKLKGSPFFPLAFMITLYCFLLLVPMTFTAMQAYQDFILNCYLWLLIGILFRLPALHATAQATAATEQERLAVDSEAALIRFQVPSRWNIRPSARR